MKFVFWNREQGSGLQGLVSLRFRIHEQCLGFRFSGLGFIGCSFTGFRGFTGLGQIGGDAKWLGFIDATPSWIKFYGHGIRV